MLLAWPQPSQKRIKCTIQTTRVHRKFRAFSQDTNRNTVTCSGVAVLAATLSVLLPANRCGESYFLYIIIPLPAIIPQPQSCCSQIKHSHLQNRDKRRFDSSVDYLWTLPLHNSPELVGYATPGSNQAEGQNAQQPGQMPPDTSLTMKRTESTKAQPKRIATIHRASANGAVNFQWNGLLNKEKNQMIGQ